MLFGKKATSSSASDSSDEPQDKYDALQKQDKQLKDEGLSNHVERIVQSKGRELHHDRRNFKCPDTTT